MPTTLSVLNAAIGEIKVRYQEPYVTEGLNAKMVGVVPRGTYRGFRLTTNGSALTVTIAADPDAGDHVAHFTTGSTDTGRHALTIRRTGGDFAVVLPPSTEWVIAISSNYVIGAPTTGEIKAYTVAEWTSARVTDGLVVLGTVTTPVSGVIPAANISHVRRDHNWLDQSSDTQGWQPLHVDLGAIVSESNWGPVVDGVLNPAFVDTTGIYTQIFGWVLKSSNTARLGFRIDSTGTLLTATDSLSPNSIVVTYVANLGVADASIHQALNAPVVPGQLVRARFRYRHLRPATSVAMNTELVFNFANFGGVFHSAQVFPVTTSGGGSYLDLVDQEVKVPAGAAYLSNVQVRVVGVDYQGPQPGDAWGVANFQVWLEPAKNLRGQAGWGGTGPVLTSEIHLLDKDEIAPKVDDLVITGTSPDLLDLRRLDGGISDRKISFGGLIQNIGAARADGDARLTFPHLFGTGFLLLMGENEATSTGFKIYEGTADKALYWVQGAYYDQGAGNWVGSANSMRICVRSGQGVRIQRSPGAGPWLEADWKDTAEFPGEFTGAINDTALMYMRGMLASKDEAARPRQRIQTIPYATSTTRTLLFEFGNTTALHRKYRLYATHFASAQNFSFLELVQGAWWNPNTSLWNKDGATSDLISNWLFQNDEIFHGVQRANVATFADSAWVYWSLSRYANTRAWGYVYTNPAYEYPALAGYGISGGYNVNYFCSFPALNRIRVTFNQAIKVTTSQGLGGGFGGSPASCTATYYNGVGIGVTPTALTSTFVDFAIYNTSSFGQFNPKTTILTFMFMIHADMFS